MTQFLFFMVLTLIGVGIGLYLRRGVPLAFIGLTGFFWGSLVWVVISVTMLFSPLPFTAGVGFVLLGLFAVGIWVPHFRRWQPTRPDRLQLAGALLLAVGVFAVFSVGNYSGIEWDGSRMVLDALDYPRNDRTPLNMFSAGWWNIYMPAMHSAAPLIGQDYLYGFQPALSVLFLGVMGVLGYRVARPVFERRGWAVVVLPLLTMSTMFAYAYHSGWVHANFPTMVFLSTGVLCLWLAIEEQNENWLVFGLLSLAAVGMLRNEGPMYVVAFLAIALSAEARVPAMRRVVAVFLGAMIIWQGAHVAFVPLVLSVHAHAAGLAMYVLLLVFVLVMRHPWVPRHLHLWVLGGVVGVFALLLMLNTPMAVESLSNLAAHMTRFWYWGGTWLIFVGLLPLVWLVGKGEADRLFTVGLPVFVLLLQLANFARSAPGHSNVWDSINRMLVHIVPLVYFAALLVIVRASQHEGWRRLTAGVAVGLLVVGLGLNAYHAERVVTVTRDLAHRSTQLYDVMNDFYGLGYLLHEHYPYTTLTITPDLLARLQMEGEADARVTFTDFGKMAVSVEPYDPQLNSEEVDTLITRYEGISHIYRGVPVVLLVDEMPTEAVTVSIADDILYIYPAVALR